MRKLINYIFKEIGERFAVDIEQADLDKEQYYGFVVTDENMKTGIMEKKKTFMECRPVFESYMYKYGLDNFSLCLLRPPYNIKLAPKLYTAEWIYELITAYLITNALYNEFRMEGKVTVTPTGEMRYVKEEGKELFIDEVAYRFFRDYVCYIPTSGDEANPDDWYTRSMLVELCQGDERIAESVFGRLSGEHPDDFLFL